MTVDEEDHSFGMWGRPEIGLEPQTLLVHDLLLLPVVAKNQFLINCAAVVGVWGHAIGAACSTAQNWHGRCVSGRRQIDTLPTKV